MDFLNRAASYTIPTLVCLGLRLSSLVSLIGLAGASGWSLVDPKLLAPASVRALAAGLAWLTTLPLCGLAAPLFLSVPPMRKGGGGGLDGLDYSHHHCDDYI